MWWVVSPIAQLDVQAAPGDAQPSSRTRPAAAGVMVTIVVSVSLVKVTVCALSRSSDRAAANSGHGLALQPRDLGLEVVEGDGELDAVEQARGHRVADLVDLPEDVERLEVGVVDRQGREAVQLVDLAGAVRVVGHEIPQCGSASSRRRSLARHRPRVGPMLPTGIPRAWATDA